MRYFFAILVILLTASAAFSQDWQSSLPQPTGQVNDFAGVLDAATKQQLETRLREFKQKTNPQVDIAVAIVNTTGDRPMFDYSLALARQWKIGSKETDNPGALLCVAIADRKYYTQVSKDLEDELPDGTVGSIQRQALVPEFKKGNYGKGIADTIELYIKTIEAKQSGTAPPVTAPPAGTTEPRRASRGGGFSCGFLLCLIPIVIIIILAASRFGRRGRSYRDRDRWGGGSGRSGGDLGDSVLPWVAGAVIGNILSGSSSGSSSSSDWGSSSGGGSDWGGFGGGGDFGGGGAGGDW